MFCSFQDGELKIAAEAVEIFAVTADPAEAMAAEARLYDVISSETKNNRLQLRLQKKSGVSNAELLGELSTRYNIRGFEEEIPSMNDVFIQTVQQ